MHGNNNDDVDPLYFDWDNNRMFDESSRMLIDQIANDPRFYDWDESDEIIHELAPLKSEDEQQSLLEAAWEVFERSVLPGLEARAREQVAQAVADPGVDALPVWHGESAAENEDFGCICTDPDPRVVEEFRRQLESTGALQRMHDAALARAEREALEIVGKLPRKTLDSLVLVNRNADREALLEQWIERPTVRRRGWIAYYAQKIARRECEQSVLDRYSAATKILTGRGWRKQAIADSMRLGVGRIDRFLDWPTGQDIADDDPLCELVPELRAHGDQWRDVSLMLRQKPKTFSRLSVDEKVDLAKKSSEDDVLIRLANQRSRRITEAIIIRHCERGDVGADVLQAILTHLDWWVREKMTDAHRVRPLPKVAALSLARDDAGILLDCDDETAVAAKALGRDDFRVTLAIREADVDELCCILAAGAGTEAFDYLVELLIERPLPKSLQSSDSFLTALLGSAERAGDSELAAVLRLIACQSPEILSRYIEPSKSNGMAVVSPHLLVTVALGEYHWSGRNARGALRATAQAIWEASDMTTEQRLARTVVAEHGSEAVVLETDSNTYVATADAIRSFRKSETIEYTYVRMLLASAAAELRSGDVTIRMPSNLPALGYHKEIRKHPADGDGPDVQAIVWPIPFRPAIYSLDVDLGKSAGLIAVCGGMVAIVEDLEAMP